VSNRVVVFLKLGLTKEPLVGIPIRSMMCWKLMSFEIIDIVFVDQRPAKLFAERTSECAFPATSQAFHHDQPQRHLSFSSFS
jgi:hypothetical protein